MNSSARPARIPQCNTTGPGDANKFSHASSPKFPNAQSTATVKSGTHAWPRDAWTDAQLLNVTQEQDAFKDNVCQKLLWIQFQWETDA